MRIPQYISQNPVAALSMLLFLLSLTQKAYCTATHCADSIMTFLLGWAALASGAAGLTWLANPLLILSWWLWYRHTRAALLCSTGALLLAFSFLLFHSVPANESGQQQQVMAYRAGYWLWLGSMVLSWLGICGLKLKQNTQAYHERIAQTKR